MDRNSYRSSSRPPSALDHSSHVEGVLSLLSDQVCHSRHCSGDYPVLTPPPLVSHGAVVPGVSVDSSEGVVVIISFFKLSSSRWIELVIISLLSGDVFDSKFPIDI